MLAQINIKPWDECSISVTHFLNKISISSLISDITHIMKFSLHPANSNIKCKLVKKY